MALTNRSSGVAGGLVTTDWWNDYYKLFTGVMADQFITINNSIELKAIAVSTSTPTLSLGAGGSMGVGAYLFAVGFVMGDGEQVPGPTASITTTSGNQTVNGASLPLGPTGTTARKIWRTKVGGSQLYLDQTISNNTATTFSSSQADTGLTVLPPPTSTMGGGLILKDVNNNKNTILGSNGDIMFNGRLGINTAGDVLDASNGTNLYLKTTSSAGTITFQFPNGTSSFVFVSNAIEVPQWLGIRKIGGTKLAEFLGNGNFVISGTQYQTSAGSIATVTGGVFDSFDVGEVFECDQVYPNGTIVCPGPDNKLIQCTHDNCHAAMVVSHNPGLGLGVPEDAKGHNYIALAGRVNIRTAADILPRQLLVSNGRGGVRPVNYEEPAFVVGFALNSTCEEGDMKGTVGVFLRSMFVILKKPQ